MATVLVDTGPLVALFDPSDRMRAVCEAELGRLRKSRLVTTIAIVTEAAYLLGFSTRAQQALLAFVAAGAIEVEPIDGRDVGAAAALMARYSGLPMDFGDATLVVLAERLDAMQVFTLDRRDFSTYRVGRRAFRLLPAVLPA